MLWKLLPTLAIALIPVSAQAVPLPQPNANGDFSGRTSHDRWVVMDSDPAGLNCRWSSAMPMEWYSPAAQWPALNVTAWPTVQRFRKNAVLTANITPAGFATLMDTRNKPWLKVSIGPNDRICLVRANTQFVRPVQP